MQLHNMTTKMSSPSKSGTKIQHRFMNTHSFLKTKFLSVLGSSNELIHEISNRLDISHSQSSASEPDGPRDPRLSVCGNDDDESVDENVIDFESRKVKEQRAREELKSGCYRQPSFIKHVRCVDDTTPNQPEQQNNMGVGGVGQYHLRIDAAGGGHHPLSLSSSPSSVANVEPRVLPPSGASAGSTTVTSPMREIIFRGGFTAQSFDVTSMSSRLTAEGRGSEAADVLAGTEMGGRGSAVATRIANSTNVSSATSENDQSDTDTSDPNRCVRTVSANSVPSLPSSLSLDSRTDESQPSLVFMRDFIEVLFADSGAITLDLKSEFGSRARTEIGRLSFARLISAKRSDCKRVNESTFYSMIQYFAIVLFECCDSEDYSPAKILMNMCFTFYHEVEVPGCEPYREYLYTYLREQPIWQSLRFWNAAIFDALQCERLRSILPTVPIPNDVRTSHAPAECRTNKKASVSDNEENDKADEDVEDDDEYNNSGETNNESNNDSSSGGDGDQSDLMTDGNAISAMSFRRRDYRPPPVVVTADRRLEEAQMHQNISFGQLGTFTCNMHAFGLPRELCTEFLRKQCVIANLNREQERTLLENVHRMYNETAKWRD